MTFRFHLAAAAMSLIWLVAPTALRADNLVLNGGFEAGNWSGWMTTPAAFGSEFNVGSQAPHTGYLAADFGATAGEYDTISQTLNTRAGSSYVLSFWLVNTVLSSDNDFQVLWNGTPVADISGNDPADSPNYANYIFTETGTGSDVLSFEGYNVDGWYNLDDVAVLGDAGGVVPEPSSVTLLGMGLLGLGALVWRHRFAA